MAIRANYESIININNDAKGLTNRLETICSQINSSLTNVSGIVVESSAKDVFSDLKTKNDSISKNIISELEHLSDFVVKQMNSYQMSAEEANKLIASAIGEFEVAYRIFKDTMEKLI